MLSHIQMDLACLVEVQTPFTGRLLAQCLPEYLKAISSLPVEMFVFTQAFPDENEAAAGASRCVYTVYVCDCIYKYININIYI